MASTNAIFHAPDAWLDMVRPAMCLYGVHPFDGDTESGLELRQVLSMKARIEYVKEVARALARGRAAAASGDAVSL